MNRVVYLRPGTRRADRKRATPPTPPREELEPDLDRLSKRMGVLSHRIERSVAAHPWRALGAVGVAGVILGVAIAPRTSKSFRQRVFFGVLALLGKRLALRIIDEIGGEDRSP